MKSFVGVVLMAEMLCKLSPTICITLIKLEFRNEREREREFLGRSGQKSSFFNKY